MKKTLIAVFTSASLVIFSFSTYLMTPDAKADVFQKENVKTAEKLQEKSQEIALDMSEAKQKGQTIGTTELTTKSDVEAVREKYSEISSKIAEASGLIDSLESSAESYFSAVDEKAESLSSNNEKMRMKKDIQRARDIIKSKTERLKVSMKNLDNQMIVLNDSLTVYEIKEMLQAMNQSFNQQVSLVSSSINTIKNDVGSLRVAINKLSVNKMGA